MTIAYATTSYPARAYNDTGEHTGPGPWLAVIHAINGLAPGAFGEPDSTESVELLGGGTRYTEHYPAFDVEFSTPYPDQPVRSTVRIMALTADAAELLDTVRKAAA